MEIEKHFLFDRKMRQIKDIETNNTQQQKKVTSQRQKRKREFEFSNKQPMTL